MDVELRRDISRRRLSANQVNLLLEALLIATVLTGLVSWTVGTSWARGWTLAHGLCGISILVLAPAKIRLSVRTGMRRGRASRWLSLGFGLLVLITAAAGLSHSTGVWFGVGWWSALWIHFLAAFSLLPLFVWHVLSRPVRTRRVDTDRRLLVGGSLMGLASGAIYGSLEVGTRALGLAGGDRRFTGSHEIASFEPARMPTVVWIDDTAPRIDTDDWELTVDGEIVPIEELRARSLPLNAVLDCTGGWFSEQSWDVVPLSEIATWSSPTIKVASSTGYTRWLPSSDATNLFLAVGYGGTALSRGHGAPVRLVVPGRRGPWWVKWVTSIESSERRWWMQLPLPPT